MTQPSANRTVTIVNAQGLHARPAYLFAQLASQFDAEVSVTYEGERVDGTSILSILTLGVAKGGRIVIEARGSDAGGAVTALAELVENEFPSPEGKRDDDARQPPSE